MAFLSGYTKRWPYTIDADQVASTLTDFPVYVDLGDMPASFWSTVANGGGDIRVTQSDGTTEVAREVVSCDTATDTGELHFLANSVDGSTDTVFYIYANGTSSDYAPTDTYGRNAVWSGYERVYHMGESSGSVAVDSTGNGDGAYQGNLPRQAAGQFGNVQDLDGSGDWITHTGLNNFHNDDLSISTWMKTNTASWGMLTGLRDDTLKDIFRFTQNSGNNIELRRVVAQSINPNGSDEDRFVTSGTYNDNAFHYVVGQYDISEAGTTNAAKIYVDGNDDTSTPISNSGSGGGMSTTYDLWIGEMHRNGFARGLPFTGLLGEMRFSSTLFSPNWITTEYNNQNDHTTWATIGAEETDGGGGAARNALFLGGGM